MAPINPEPSELWAYRARGVDPLEPVTVIRHGTERPARVLVRFEAEARDELEEWVAPRRLKVPWDQRYIFMTNEAHWQAVRSLSPDRDSAEAMAADEVRMLLVPQEVAVILGTVLEIHDAAALAELSGVSVEELTGHPLAFETEGRMIAPWPVTLKVAEGLAQRHPDQVLAQVEQEERQLQHELVHGFPAEAWPEPRDIESEIDVVRELDERGYRQSRELRRQWCGAEAVVEPPRVV